MSDITELKHSGISAKTVLENALKEIGDKTQAVVLTLDRDGITDVWTSDLSTAQLAQLSPTLQFVSLNQIATEYGEKE